MNNFIVFINRYVQKEVPSRRNKQARSNENTFRRLPSLLGMTPEDPARIIPRASEDPSDIEVNYFSLNPKSSILYPFDLW
jgi:hypothetical protein